MRAWRSSPHSGGWQQYLDLGQGAGKGNVDGRDQRGHGEKTEEHECIGGAVDVSRRDGKLDRLLGGCGGEADWD